MNETHFYFCFFYFCFSFYFFSYHISDSLFYLSHQIITVKHKISHISHSKKIFKNSADQLHAVQVADHCVILIARNKIKKTSEWINANKKKQKSIMNHVKKMWYVKKKIMIFLIRNINNSKTLINNINFFYWTRNKVCRKKQKKCKNQKQCSQNENKFTNYEAETENQK